MSTTCHVMPGWASATGFSASARLPAMITAFPAWWNALARPMPMPELPPVIRMVLPLIFMSPKTPCRGRPR